MTHIHTHSKISDDKNAKCLLWAFSVTVTFMVIELIGGLIPGSLALLADAGHMLTDAVSLLFALLAICLSRRSPNSRHTFGWLRLTTIVAFLNAISLIIITLLILWEAIQRFFHPQPISGLTMMIIALIGLVANLVVLRILYYNNENKNLNMRAAVLHVISDLLGSVGTIAAALIILYTGWTLVDPILSILVSCLILRSAWALLKESVNELLECAPISLDILEIEQGLRHSIPEVRNVHHMHVWQVGEKPVMTLHVQVIPTHDHDALLSRIQYFIKHQYEIAYTTIQMEYQLCSRFNSHHH